MTRIARLLIPVFVLSTLTIACGDDDEPRASTPTSARPRVPAAAQAIDWTGLTQHPHDLGGGWSLRDAAGDGPFIEVIREGRSVGAIEILTFPLSSMPDLHGNDPGAALRAHAQDFADTVRADRTAGCGADYEFTPRTPTSVQLDDGAAIRYGFRGGPRGAGEASLQWAGIRGANVVVVAVPAYDPGGCIGTEGAEMDVATLDALEPRLIAAVEAGALPTSR